jgi:hypothetical protein
MVENIAKQLNISIGSACSVVHDSLQFHKVCARWVPNKLTDEYKCIHLHICSRHLACYHEGDTTFCFGSSQVMKPGFTTINQKPSGRACNGTIRQLLQINSKHSHRYES